MNLIYTQTNARPRMHGIIYAIALLLLITVVSCSKDNGNTNPAPIDPVVPADYGNFYKVIRVSNFKGDTTDNAPTTPKATMYYSLDSNKQVAESYQKTTKWDLSFGALYQSAIAGNNGKDVANNGYGTSAIGGVLILKQAFESVTDIPADDQFKTGKDLYSTDDAGAFGGGVGWYLYDFGGDIVGDKSYDKQHVVYALGDTITLADQTKLSPRTLVVRTANGNYAKMKMISVYKDAYSIDQWSRNTPHMYFTFEYVMVPKGSKKFEIKN